MLKDYPDVLTISDLMEILHCCENMVYKLLNNGDIKAKKMGRKWLVPKISVIKYLQSSLYTQ